MSNVVPQMSHYTIQIILGKVDLRVSFGLWNCPDLNAWSIFVHAHLRGYDGAVVGCFALLLRWAFATSAVAGCDSVRHWANKS